MNYELIRLNLEVEVSAELRNIIQFDVIDNIIQEAKIEDDEDYYQNLLEGQSLKFQRIFLQNSTNYV